MHSYMYMHTYTNNPCFVILFSLFPASTFFDTVESGQLNRFYLNKRTCTRSSAMEMIVIIPHQWNICHAQSFCFLVKNAWIFGSFLKDEFEKLMNQVMRCSTTLKASKQEFWLELCTPLPALVCLWLCLTSSITIKWATVLLWTLTFAVPKETWWQLAGNPACCLYSWGSGPLTAVELPSIPGLCLYHSSWLSLLSEIISMSVREWLAVNWVCLSRWWKAGLTVEQEFLKYKVKAKLWRKGRFWYSEDKPKLIHDILYCCDSVPILKT